MFKNINPIEIMTQMDHAIDKLESQNEDLKKLGENKAETRRKYYVALNKKILELKADKFPATLILPLSKGEAEVAQLRFDKDVAESIYYTAIDALNNTRIEIDVLRSKLTWLRSEFKNS